MVRRRAGLRPAPRPKPARRPALLLFCALILALPAFAADPQRTVLTLAPNGVVTVTLPDAVLDHAAVKKQLASALTTTFLVVGRVRGTALPPVASRLEIRYDLWDEVYYVRRIDAARRVETQRIATQEQLLKWWRAPLRVATIPARAFVDVELTVLPYSAAEEDDAREWLSKGGGVGASSTRSSGVVDALIGTTISARPLVSFRWSAEVVR